MGPKITLIGTMHFDYEGEKTLERRLKKLQPSHIIVEGVEENTKIMTDIQKEIRERIMQMNISLSLKQRIDRLNSIPNYEHRVAKHYAKKYKTFLQYFEDMDILTEDQRRIFLESGLEAVEEVAARGEWGILWHEEKIRNDVMRYGDMAKTNLKFPDIEWRDDDKENNYFKGRSRDVVMAEKCREIAARNPNVHLAVIVGMAHIMNDIGKSTLYEIIRDMKPGRIFNLVR